MCGIIGYVGKKNSVPYIIDGLKKLTHDIVIFVNVFIIQIISFLLLFVLCDKKIKFFVSVELESTTSPKFTAQQRSIRCRLLCVLR